jgi:hypothetical protein
MSFEIRELQGSLFKNERAREGKNDPAYQGSCLIDGKHYWISAWVKSGTKGKFFSFAFKPKEQGARKPDPTPPPQEEGPPLTDEPPF